MPGRAQEAMSRLNRDFEGPLSHVQLRGHRSISGLALFSDEQPLQSLELNLLAVSNGFAAQLILHAIQHRQRPLAFEDPIGCQMAARFEAVSTLGVKDVIQGNGWAPATSLLCGGRVALVGDEVLQRGQQERSEASTFPIEVTEIVLLEHVREESLCQVLGFVVRVPEAAHVRVDRIPARTAENRQCLVRARSGRSAGRVDQRDASCRERCAARLIPPWRAIIVADPNLTPNLTPNPDPGSRGPASGWSMNVAARSVVARSVGSA